MARALVWARAVGAAVAAFGALVLAGWALDAPFLTTGDPGGVRVKANVALGLVLGGVALVILAPSSRRSARVVTFGNILAIATAVLGASTLTEYLAGADLGIDQLLARDRGSVFGAETPGRMAPTSALLLFLMGVALLASSGTTRRSQIVAHGLALASGLAAFLAVVGYLYRVEALYRVASFTQIALPTALASLALSVGILLARPATGLVGLARSRTAGGLLVRRMLPLAVLLPPALGWLRARAQRAGLIEAELGVSLLMVAQVAIFGAFTWWCALAVSRQEVENRTARDALRRSEESFRVLVEGVRDHAICTLDTAGTVVSWNKGAERLEGYRAEEIVGQSFSKLFVPEEVAAGTPRAELSRAATEGRSEHDGWRLRKDGTRYWANMVLSALRAEDGRLEGFAKVARDMTDPKRAENKLRAYATRLERSNRELETFAAVASHDLQEPLRKIRAFGDRLVSKHSASLAPEGRDDLARMSGAAGRMQELIDNLLTFSRVATKGAAFVDVDLADIAREVVSDLEVRIAETKASVEIGELPVLEADASQMRQLFQNLLANALKFHAVDVAPVVKLRASTVPAGAEDAPVVYEISVEDNGIGFEQEHAERIFGVFQRLHGRSEYEGTGIGLAICRRIVERHHGTIVARAALGAGATFTIRLPAVQPSDEETP